MLFKMQSVKILYHNNLKILRKGDYSLENIVLKLTEEESHCQINGCWHTSALKFGENFVGNTNC